MNKDSFYTLLDISAHATSAEIDAAYQRQRDRYSAERVAALGDEFQAIAEARNAELERAYTVLSNAERRRAYQPPSAQFRPGRDRWANRAAQRLSRQGGAAQLLVHWLRTMPRRNAGARSCL